MATRFPAFAAILVSGLMALPLLLPPTARFDPPWCQFTMLRCEIWEWAGH